MTEKLTEENYLRAESNILKLSGLPEECFEKRNVKVGEFDGDDVYIHTLIIK